MRWFIFKVMGCEPCKSKLKNVIPETHKDMSLCHLQQLCRFIILSLSLFSVRRMNSFDCEFVTRFHEASSDFFRLCLMTRRDVALVFWISLKKLTWIFFSYDMNVLKDHVDWDNVYIFVFLGHNSNKLTAKWNPVGTKGLDERGFLWPSVGKCCLQRWTELSGRWLDAKEVRERKMFRGFDINTLVSILCKFFTSF